MHRTLAFSLAALLAASLSVPSSARPGMGADHGFGFLEHIADQIGLSEDQEDSINQLINSAELASAVDRERMGQIREAMRALSETGEVFDQAAAETLADELAQIVARTAVAGAEVRWQVRQVFTAEQQEQINAMKAERAGMRSRFGPGQPGME